MSQKTFETNKQYESKNSRYLRAYTRGRKAAERLASGNLTHDQERALRLESDRGKRAFKNLLDTNKPFVAHMVKDLLGSKANNQDMEDWVCVGLAGLATAIEKFDMDRGTSLATYAKAWIKKEILGEMSFNATPVKLSEDERRALLRYRRAVRELEAEQQGHPTRSEIAERMECSVDQVAYIEGASKSIFSIDAPIDSSDESSAPFHESMVCASAEDEMDDVLREDWRERMRGKLWEHADVLDDRELYVIACDAADEQGGKVDNKRIASELAISSGRVSQIRKRALSKLRDEFEADESFESFGFGL